MERLTASCSRQWRNRGRTPSITNRASGDDPGPPITAPGKVGQHRTSRYRDSVEVRPSCGTLYVLNPPRIHRRQYLGLLSTSADRLEKYRESSGLCGQSSIHLRLADRCAFEERKLRRNNKMIEWLSHRIRLRAEALKFPRN